MSFQMPSAPEPPDQPATPRLEMPEELKASRLITMVSLSDGWDLTQWPSSDLVMAQAGLKHMLKLVERQMGERKLIAPHRETR